jgi:hypothetical protein
MTKTMGIYSENENEIRAHAFNVKAAKLPGWMRDEVGEAVGRSDANSYGTDDDAGLMLADLERAIEAENQKIDEAHAAAREIGKVRDRLLHAVGAHRKRLEAKNAREVKQMLQNGADLLGKLAGGQSALGSILEQFGGATFGATATAQNEADVNKKD